MSNCAIDIFQNYILNCYIYLHHNDISTSQHCSAPFLAWGKQHSGISQPCLCADTRARQHSRASKEPGLEDVKLVCSFLTWLLQALIVAHWRRIFSFSFLLYCCSWQRMKVAEWCYMGCACKLQYNSTLQRCSISICYHKFISYFLSFIKNAPRSLYK